MTSQSTYPPKDDEDTVELELTAAELRGLSRAARQAYAAKSASTSQAQRTAEKSLSRLWLLALAAALIGIAATIAWHPLPPHHGAPRPAPIPGISGAPAPLVQPAVLAEPPGPQRPPVRVRNPFDATEVFEFPAGTTRAEARQKVADVLLQRAVDRGSAGIGLEAAHKPRAPNN